MSVSTVVSPCSHRGPLPGSEGDAGEVMLAMPVAGAPSQCNWAGARRGEEGRMAGRVAPSPSHTSVFKCAARAVPSALSLAACFAANSSSLTLESNPEPSGEQQGVVQKARGPAPQGAGRRSTGGGGTSAIETCACFFRV